MATSTLPFVLFRTADGSARPSRSRRNHAVTHTLCGFCGEILGDRVAFVGGSLQTSRRSFSMPGMHESCAHSAVRSWQDMFTPDGGAEFMLLSDGYKVALVYRRGRLCWSIRPCRVLSEQTITSS